MGLFDFFTKDGRDNARSRLAYQECSMHRAEKLLSYRANAVQDIMFQYPDARLLLNRYDRRFMVLQNNKGRLSVGQFADDYYPRLDFVDDTATAEERFGAVERYRNEVSRCNGNIAERLMPRFKEHRFASTEHDFRTKGYRLCWDTHLVHLAGGALFLNATRIASCSILSPQPQGHLTKAILQDVVQAKPVTSDVVSLSFFVVGCDHRGEWAKLGYQIMFDSSLAAFNETYRSEYAATIVNLRDFVYELEQYLSSNTDLLGLAPEFDDAMFYPIHYDELSIERRFFW